MSSSQAPVIEKPTATPPSYKPSTTHGNGVRLLALDGGGVRGLASLIILDAIMKEVKARTGKTSEPCRPADYFELAAGTSTGGIIGIMLFRLHMTTDDAITEYFKIGEQIFAPKLFGRRLSWAGSWLSSLLGSLKLVFKNSRFDDKDLKKAIDDIVQRYGIDEKDKQLKGAAPLIHPGAGRTIVCATAKNRNETCLLRSYHQNIDFVHSFANDAMKDGQDQATISLAACATSAAPSYFPEVKWSVGEKDFVFWDGGLLNNNPIDQLWYSRYDLVQPSEPPPKVSCVISLGTGYVRPGSATGVRLRLLGMANSVIGFATNTEAKGKDFSRHMTSLNRRDEFKDTKYFRFNPPLGLAEISLSDYNKMGELRDLTNKYLAVQKQKDYIHKAADALLQPRSNEVKST